MSSEKSQGSDSVFERGGNYISASIDELKKVSTPTRQETSQATIATLAIIVFFAISLLVLDFVCHYLMGLLT